jgi:uncharacterized protein (TIGR03032 family)
MDDRANELSEMWSRHSADWRDTSQVCSQWREAADIDPRLLEFKASKEWWKIIAGLGITLLITREYEHLVIALSTVNTKPRVSFLPVPHPSGLAIDRKSNRVMFASTRNPNQIYTWKPVTSALERLDIKARTLNEGLLAPVSSTFYPGSLYLHDLAILGSGLYANAVGHNAVVRLEPDGSFKRVWWPKSIERHGQPIFSRNHIQLNSIAGGKTLQDSYFTASSAETGRLRPGHLNYPVDQTGVVLSGRSREPVCFGLTRPHSARLHNGQVWLANSGYGQFGFVSGNRLEVVAHLPGWTRGLCIIKDVAFAGTSRVIPRYARYAPGLATADSRCAIHAVSCNSGELLGSLEWPSGNQIFAVDWIDDQATSGFPFSVSSRKRSQELALFYTYLTN